MTLVMAGIMIIYRKYPDITAALPAALSSIILLPLTVLFSNPTYFIKLFDILSPVWISLCCGSSQLVKGARRFPSAETALLSILEMLLAPILALLILSEVPTPQAIVGGVIILCAVLWSQARKGV